MKWLATALLGATLAVGAPIAEARADTEAALRLPLQNLALVEQSGFSEVTMPCAACWKWYWINPGPAQQKSKNA